MYAPIHGPDRPIDYCERAGRFVEGMRRELAAGHYAAARVYARFAADSQLSGARSLSCETAMKLAYLQCWTRLERQALAAERSVALMAAIYGVQRRAARALAGRGQEA